MIDWLPEDKPPSFPNTRLAKKDPNGLLAAGGRLTPDWLVMAYRHGIFPWFDDESPILWWSPAPRMVLNASDLHLSRSVRKLMKRPPFRITCNQAFDEVIYQCALPRDDHDQAGTWITQDMEQAYIQLNRNGICHSVECWDQLGNLVGGLYGLLIDRVFFGESMFNKTNNGSKLAFAFLAKYLFNNGIQFIDCQMHTEHMANFGAKEIERELFENKLNSALNQHFKLSLPVLLTP